MISGIFSNLHLMQIHSPKAYLASYLAYSLGTFFDLDPKLIESNLLSDAKIVLHDICLKPQELFHKKKIVVGKVEEIELSWTWGGAVDGSTLFVHEALLAIRGARFRIRKATAKQEEEPVLAAANRQQESSSSSITLTPERPSIRQYQHQQQDASLSSPIRPDESNLGDDIGAYFSYHVQSIIDALRLEFTNSELTIETEIMEPCNADAESTHHKSPRCLSKENIVFQVQSLQVESLGREKEKHTCATTRHEEEEQAMDEKKSEKGPLPPFLSFEQRITFDSLSAHLVEIKIENDDGSDDNGGRESCRRTISHPLLDPFPYAATIKQVSGKRFVGGFATGFEVVGEEVSSSHCGRDCPSQEAAVGGRTKKSSLPPNNNSTLCGIVLHAGAAQIQALTRIIEEVLLLTQKAGHDGLDSPKTQQDSNHSPNKDQKEVWDRTSFFLPMPSISVILPNDSSVQIPHCTFHYLTDGSIILFQGSKGIRFNEVPVLQLSEPIRWRVDLIRQEFCLDYGDVTENDTFYDAKQTSTEQDWTTQPPGVLATVKWRGIMKELIMGIKQFILAIERGREQHFGSEGT